MKEPFFRVKRDSIEATMRLVVERRWLLPALIVCGVVCLFFVVGRSVSPRMVEATPQALGNGELFVVPIQIQRDVYGVAMVDTGNQTLWIYEFAGRGPGQRQLVLSSARSWRYDRLIQQYKTADPTPNQVKMLLENLGELPKRLNDNNPHDANTGGSEALRFGDR